MTTLSIHKDKSMWLLFIATILLSGLFAFINLSEFVTVGVLKQTSGYPFGSEGPTPWYYKSAKLYAIVNLIFGLLFLFSFSTALWTFVRQKKKALLVAFVSASVIILIQLISGQSA